LSCLILIYTILNTFSFAAEIEVHPDAPQRTLQFAGVTWNVRTGYGGPGPNYWSDSAESVWLDGDGHLHMRINKIGDRWYCSEVYTEHFTQYGEHRFVVEGDIDKPDKNTVLGLFVYADDTHEIDIEFSKWGNQNLTNLASYTIQPYTVSGNSTSFAIELDDSVSTHLFNWQQNYILFTSYQGIRNTASTLLNNWVYTGDYIPGDTDKLRVHINFWLFTGSAPVDTNNLEVIIRDVKMPAPLGTSVDQPEDLKLKSFYLEQNYPNPFNPKTVISWQLAVGSGIELNVYNLVAQKVASLVSDWQPAGHHQIEWNATGLSSGVYLCRLTTDHGFSQTRKLVLMK
jgi:hypothetical protein